MTVYGECGDCLVRIVAQGVLPHNLTIECREECTGFGTSARLELLVRQSLFADECTVRIYTDNGDVCNTPLAKQACTDCEGYDVFACDIRLEKPMLMFCRISARVGGRTVYVTDDGTGFAFSENPECDVQISAYKKQYSSPDWLDGGVFYQIFIDRFARGGSCKKRDDAIMIDDWDNGVPEYNDGRHEFKNNTFFGGTLIGAAEKLDYLASIGVTCVYLSPCFEAYSNHKYDTGDYMHVDEMFGGDEALRNFVSEASKRGIAVMLDGVFNHVGDDSIYFDRYQKHFGACVSKQSPYYDWFSFSSYPDTYDCWWGMKNLPKVKRSREFRDFICNKVVPHYMSMGIAGWRLDVADELEADFLDELTSAVKSCRPDAIVLGEVWEDASNKIAYDERKRYFLGSQLDSVMNYPIRNGIIEACLMRDASSLRRVMRVLWQHYPPEQMRHTMNILGTHDTERILTVLGDADVSNCTDDDLAHMRLPHDRRAWAMEALKLCYTILAFAPGVPCIYYGDEIGMEGYHDPFCRLPYKWNNADGVLRKHFMCINLLRRENKALLQGELVIADLPNEHFAFKLVSKEGELLITACFADTAFIFEGVSTDPFKAHVFKKTEDGKWFRML